MMPNSFGLAPEIQPWTLALTLLQVQATQWPDCNYAFGTTGCLFPYSVDLLAAIQIKRKQTDILTIDITVALTGISINV